ncbi:MAG: 16S rRNA (cytosine(967)-C(5))-methyltransferase RsmB, partial [Clostridia bacterium]|nr:16S rRNA (cytosine(967)-C(5))-methyltransferase RsmB [Clostridia bacterium]
MGKNDSGLSDFGEKGRYRRFPGQDDGKFMRGGDRRSSGSSDRRTDGGRPGRPEWKKDGERPVKSEWNKDGERPGKPEWKRDGERPGKPEWKRDAERPGKPEWKRDGEHSGKPEWKKNGDRSDRGVNRIPGRSDRKTAETGGSDGLASRRVALETLLDVTQKDAYAQLALEKRLRQANLDGRDSAFVTRLVYGTIENRIALDYRVNQLLDKPDELDPTAREILRMGAYQLFYMDRVPDMAATDSSVKLTRSMGMEGLTGVVNAVLRGMIRNRDEMVWPDPEADPIRYLSVMNSCPEALCRMLIERFGEEGAREIIGYRNPVPYESIRPNLLRCDIGRLKRVLEEEKLTFEPGLVEGTFRVYDPGDLTRTRAYQNGLFTIQGESSVLAARAVGAKPGQTVLDACAAPGGKTALISEMMQDTGRVYAWDTHPHRVDLIRGTATRLHLENVRPMMRDAQVERPDMAGSLDAALIDAPCTGSGVMHIKPDLKYRITP